VTFSQKERLLGQELGITHHNSVHTIVIKVKSVLVGAETVIVGEKETKRTLIDICQILS